MTATSPNPFPGIFMLLGTALLIAGTAWVYRPAAVILAGLALLVLGFCGRREGQ